MEIRKKLTYQFIAIVALILFISSLAIYISFSRSRKEEFYSRLANKTMLVAQMLINIEEIDADLLRKIEKNNPLSLPNEKIIIFDYQNRQIYNSDENHILEIPAEYVNKVRIAKEVKYVQKPYEIFGAFYTSEYDRIVVFVAATDIFGINKLKRLQLILLLVFISSLIIVYFAGRIFSARALKPVTNIISQVNGISITNINERIDEGNETDELARLAKTFNGMLQRLGSAFKVQKNFIDNASHELRTPLTVISGQLEVVLMKERTNDEYKNTIISVHDEIRNLNNLSNRLLLLAQASSDKAAVSFTSVRIDDTLWNARAELLKHKNNYSINISFGENIKDDSKLVVSGNDVLLKIAFGNLIDNSCKYSHDNKSDVIVDNQNNKLVIRFEDNGFGVPAEELKLIFQPFHRATNSAGIKGHGIGLSLADKIISLHNGLIEVNSEVNSGSQFIIYLPAMEEFLITS
jgi:signal transduction histidine kinase